MQPLSEDLQENLLDHICCIIENELGESEDFYKFYEKILPRFFKKDLRKSRKKLKIYSHLKIITP